MVLMIVSGRSGSGKSVALRALEDMGFYCVDNLPVVLLPDWRDRWLTVISPRPSASTCVTCRNPRRSSSRRCRICRNVFSAAAVP